MKFISVLVLTVCLTGIFALPAFQYGAATDDIMAVNAGCKEELNDNIVDIDVRRTPEEKAEMRGEIQNGLTKKSDNKRWPGGVLHYTISNSFSNQNKELIRKAARDIEMNTCIKMKEHQVGREPRDHVAVYPGSGCWSYIGRTGGKQQLSIQVPGCAYKGTIIHEFLHALGVNHEQSRKDRDNYVTIKWENIQNNLESNFQKRDTDSLGVGYDHKSVMHYGRYAFSKNGQMTIYNTKNPSESLGGRQLTALDIRQLNLFYDCNGPVTTKSTTTKSTTSKTTTTMSTTPKKTTTKSTTLKSTTTKSTTPKTTTTKKTTPETTTTKSTTEKPFGVCGDSKFKCVRAYYNPGYYCKQRFYQNYCHQSCDVCDNGNDDIECRNFQDNEDYDCNGKAMKGYCKISVYRIRFRMKNNCPRTCCDEGYLYR